MKIPINDKDLAKIKYFAMEAYKRESVNRMNREDFLALAYLLGISSWLKEKGVDIEISNDCPSFESLNDE